MKHVIFAIFCIAFAAHAAEPGFANFITRQGNKLMDGDKEFRFMGANMPGLVLPYDWTLFLPERLHLPTPWEQEDGFKTLDQMNLRVVRLWNLPMRSPKDGGTKPTWHYIQGPGQFNEESFKVVDSLFALANKYQVRVIFDFTAESGDYLGGIGTYAAFRGKKRSEFYTDPQLKEDYKATVKYVITRVNSITGVAYKDEKAVLAWQFGNEMHSAPTEWLSEMAAYIKSLDPNHLVAETRHRPGAPLVIDKNIDLYTRHLYGNYPGVGNGWPAAMKKEVDQLKGERPMFVGEFGPYVSSQTLTHENVVAKTREFLDYIREEKGMSGALIWSMYFHHQEGGFYWHQIMTYPAVWSYHWPGFTSAAAQREEELMALLREQAFKIRGEAITPVPVPDAPMLLPIGEVPMFSWRGSAGATAYDVERAAQRDGPWAVVGKDVCDGDVAYRPLFSDTTAKVGQSYFYRVIAKNGSGASRPSNVAGPVAVKRICLVDELQDFSRTIAHGEKLAINNAYNALYAEYLFRAKGDAKEFVTYQVTGPISAIRLVAFFDKSMDDLKVETSTDGKTFTPVQSKRSERKLPAISGGAASGQRRTLVEYQAGAPATEHRFVRIVWSGPAELDRVEIEHE